jgi:thiamine pyrophosphate-dependent acetolactate synthase large subunit-like protein
MSMNRRAALEILKRHIADEIVVGVYSTGADWAEINDRPLNYFSFGAMGLGSSHGLGLALARPERTVVVLDGDGSLLMNLGTLVTIGKVAPANLVHMVFRNGVYEANGSHPIPNPEVDFAGMARAAGFANVASVARLEDFARGAPEWLKGRGPTFVCVDIEDIARGPADYPDLYKPQRRQALRDALAAS